MASNPSTLSYCEGSNLTQRRARHITAVQIRNLTLFPARDALASALTQPAEKPNVTSLGNLSDDLDVTLTRRRSRRISTTSARTVKSHISEDAIREDNINEAATGRPSTSRVSFSVENDGISRQKSTSSVNQNHRPYRARTSSMASVSSRVSALSNSVTYSSGSLSTPFSAFFPDNSQASLEKVIKSRLVETFVTVSIPRSRKPPVADSKPSLSTPPTSPRIKSSFSGSKATESGDARKPVANSPLSNRETAKPMARRGTVTASRGTTKGVSPHTRSGSTSSLRANGDLKSHATRSPIPPAKSARPTPEPSPSPTQSMYFSSIHRPSTNPSFSLDFPSQVEDDADLGGDKVKIELWAKVSQYTRSEMSRKGKEKEADTSDVTSQDWKLLDEWDVDLDALVPLEEDPVSLPSNSLLLTLSPPNRTFCLSSQLRSSRSETPSVGYTSDPESELRKVKQAGDSLPTGTSELSEATTTPVAVSRRRMRKSREHGPAGNEEVDNVKTANYQELLRLANLHACISEEEDSLADLVGRIDSLVEVDGTFAKRRNISEREARIDEIRENHKQVLSDMDKLRASIAAKSNDIQRRRETLYVAGEQLHADYDEELLTDEELNQERCNLSSLQGQLVPTRTTLLSILSSIYPIELFSPPDLLFTILDVPLPIPLTATDPAPPLSLPNHKEITEDVVATSLGYAAQLVQLMAAYLGQGLVYPITCVGSRSLIRDGISTMVGPRVFPLFSKGVDAYRFEYGVYLLNKDIEMLMSERDLRALDMRHTLANLKNLLLTLTSGECAEIQRPPRIDSPLSLASQVEQDDISSDSEESEDPQEPKTPTAETEHGLHSLTVSNTPPASGSTTPTVSTTPTATITDTARKSRAFLTFPPLTSFFRTRQPSPVPTIEVEGPSEAVDPSEDHLAEEPQATPEVVIEGSEQDDDEDRKTISGVARDTSTAQEASKSIGESVEDSEKGEPRVDSHEGRMVSSPLPPVK